MMEDKWKNEILGAVAPSLVSWKTYEVTSDNVVRAVVLNHPKPTKTGRAVYSVIIYYYYNCSEWKKHSGFNCLADDEVELKIKKYIAVQPDL